MKIPDNAIVWAFDLGKGSIGEAIRQGKKFLHKASLLIPADFAETKTAAVRRRMWRTRLAHKAREEWLDKVWSAAGLSPLAKRRHTWNEHEQHWVTTRADYRLEREFAPADGKPGKDGAPADSKICYTSCLLRIRLLRGEELEAWQIYKALHSAIQKRGYAKVPWADRAARRGAKTEEQIEQELARKDPGYRAAIEAWGKFKAQVPEEFHFPCYYDAWRMGLWDPRSPSDLLDKTSCRASSTRNVRFDRADVFRELAHLSQQAVRQLPELAEAFEKFRNSGWTERDEQTSRSKRFPVCAETFSEFLCYGPGGKEYASYDAEVRKAAGLHPGSTDDWLGVLGQKIPRFDNRIIGKCALIPRLNVCTIRSDEDGQPLPQARLAAEVVFLLKLKNLLVQRVSGPDKLTVDELRKVFAHPRSAKLTLSKAAWRKICLDELGVVPLPGHEEVTAPRYGGRSRFCRPALDLLKRLILSGMKPSEFYAQELARLKGNCDPKKGLVVPDDLQFLRAMSAGSDSWRDIYVPDQQLEVLAQRSHQPEDAIDGLIRRQNDAVVRHRLKVFAQRLVELEKMHGKPDYVVLEFVREDFMGEKAKLEYSKFLRDREKERKEARQEALKAGATSKSAGLRLELLRAQGGICLYTGEGLAATKLDDYAIDHIVPRSRGGPDAAINYVLTTHATNEAKGDKTPYEWLSTSEGWDAYVNRVRACGLRLRNKKVQLLISANAGELAEKYTALAETAWISKLAQAICSLRFRWKNGNDASGQKRVIVVSGGLTARIRRKYELNRLLNPAAKDEEEAEKKNRDDARHHALDAMVISFMPAWVRDRSKEGFFRFPDGVNSGFFAREIASINPRNMVLEKPSFEETLYGLRVVKGHRFIVGREKLVMLAIKTTQNRETLKQRSDIETHRIVDARIRRDVEAYWNQHSTATLEEWKLWCANYRLGSGGPRVENVFVTKSKADSIEEYRNIAKADTGQRGQYKRGARHRGYFIYERPAPTRKEPGRTQVGVRPVFVFENQASVRAQLQARGDWSVHGFFQSGCQVRLEKAWSFQEKTFPAGEYILGSIWSNGNAKLKHPVFGEIGPVGLRILLSAGFQRVWPSQ